MYYSENSVLNKVQFHPVAVLFFSFGILLFLLGQSSLIFEGFMQKIYGIESKEFQDIINMKSPEYWHRYVFIGYLAFVQASSFLLSGLIFSQLAGNLKEEISFKNVNWKFYALSFIIVVVSFIFLQSLVIDKETFSLASDMKDLEKSLEEEELKIKEKLLAVMKNGLGLNIIAFALVPAICEEIFFRGFFMKNLSRVLNFHYANLITAFVFSLIHFQPYGFFVRFLLGLFFGYFVQRSGSIFNAMIGHFTFNTISVILGYLASNQLIDQAYIDDNVSFPFLLILISFVLTLFFGRIFMKLSEKNNESENNEINQD